MTTESDIYMTTAHQQQTPQPKDQLKDTDSFFFIRMIGRTLLLMCMAVFICADAEGKSRLYRRPSCVGTATQACPLNYSPVCGSNGVTYPNECALCIHRLEKNADILIVKDGPC